MDTGELLAARMASQLLLEPAPTMQVAAKHMLATQSQDFAAGRYALTQRCAEPQTRDQVNALFNEGLLVRSWTMRGTLHICAAEDLRWMMRATRERTLRQAATRLRGLQIGTQAIDQAAAALSGHLQEHGRASRPELFHALNARGIETGKQRGIHLLQVLALNGLICQGPIPHNAGLIAQDFVMAEQWVTEHHEPQDPMAELLRRYLDSHGPATIRDAAWYAGQTLTTMRTAAEALGELLVSVGTDERGEEYWVVADGLGHRSIGSSKQSGFPLRLLGPFDEYYLGYTNRSIVADEEMTQQILPGKNGMFLPFWLEQGRASRIWNAETAPSDKIGAALHQRYLDFKTAR